MSRVIFGWANASVKEGVIPNQEHGFTVFAGVIWAMVMYLFSYQKGTLQKSLISSMTYLYEGMSETGRICR